ncbi:MAG TPA: hypothetical protein VFG21_11620 [Xanthomonadaceae bacterium]|nr:hypothetical protein [Xanthomonadaceae bacterium]
MNALFRFALAALAASLLAPAAAAQGSGAALASQDSNWSGVVIEVTEFRRKGNTLSVKTRLRNTGAEAVEVDVRYGDVYVLDTAGGKRYDVLRDDKGAVIAAHLPSWPERWYGTIEPGAAMTLWMKFPAPPADTTEATLVIGTNAPFEDLPIEDA